jgi:hypothetical protein
MSSFLILAFGRFSRQPGFVFLFDAFGAVVRDFKRRPRMVPKGDLLPLRKPRGIPIARLQG